MGTARRQEQTTETPRVCLNKFRRERQRTYFLESPVPRAWHSIFTCSKPRIVNYLFPLPSFDRLVTWFPSKNLWPSVALHEIPVDLIISVSTNSKRTRARLFFLAYKERRFLEFRKLEEWLFIHDVINAIFCSKIRYTFYKHIKFFSIKNFVHPIRKIINSL